MSSAPAGLRYSSHALGASSGIGRDIQPKPQIMGFLLHELIPLELQSRHPGEWRPEKAKNDKDLVYIPDPTLSVELKTSSHPSQIFGTGVTLRNRTAKARARTDTI